MKYFHIHVSVDDLNANIDFYNKLFGQNPVKQRADYAQWVLDDPRVNFAISSRGHTTGLNHLGIQTTSRDELEELKSLVDAASGGTASEQISAACCYAVSDKHWLLDPQGLAWEYFHTHSQSETYGHDTVTPSDNACCIPLFSSDVDSTAGNTPCCVSDDAVDTETTRCCQQGLA